MIGSISTYVNIECLFNKQTTPFCMFLHTLAYPLPTTIMPSMNACKTKPVYSTTGSRPLTSATHVPNPA